MIRINKLVILLSFALAMGCGESSSGQGDSQAANGAADRPAAAAPAEPVAALSDGPEPGKTMAEMSPVTYVEGTHYERLPRPVATVDQDKIEVAEVFWYGCSHCYDFESLFREWQADVGDDVVVVKSPAMWDDQGVMAKHARIFYTAKALGVEEKITPAAFRALIVDRNPLRTEEAIAKLFTDAGVPREEFDRTFNSFGVTSAVRQAEARQQGYRVKGTPEVVVDGTYRISTRMAGSHEAVLKVTDFLVEKIREEEAAGNSESAGG